MIKKTYRDLDVWQASMSMIEAVYDLTRQFPQEEQFGLISQMRRAAVSVASNIAEGAGRNGTKEYVNHLSIARGSLFELETQLTIAVRLGFIDRKQAVPIWDQLQRIGQMIARLMMALRKKIAQHRTSHATRRTN